MACKFIDISLRVVLHTFAFGNHIPYEFMIFFKLSFLVRGIWITVKYVATPPSLRVFFDVPGVLKFWTIISQNDFKVLSEKMYKEMVFTKSLKAFITHSWVHLGSRIIIMKLQLLNRRVMRHLPASLVPFTVSSSSFARFHMKLYFFWYSWWILAKCFTDVCERGTS